MLSSSLDGDDGLLPVRPAKRALAVMACAGLEGAVHEMSLLGWLLQHVALWLSLSDQAHTDQAGPASGPLQPALARPVSAGRAGSGLPSASLQLLAMGAWLPQAPMATSSCVADETSLPVHTAEAALAVMDCTGPEARTIILLLLQHIALWLSLDQAHTGQAGACL